MINYWVFTRIATRMAPAGRLEMVWLALSEYPLVAARISQPQEQVAGEDGTDNPQNRAMI